MQDPALDLLRTNLDDAHLGLFAERLNEWLVADLNQAEGETPSFTESRAKALLRASDVIDAPTLHSFDRMLGKDALAGDLTAFRVAIYGLLQESGLAENDEIVALAATSGAAAEPEGIRRVTWLGLTVAAFAWKAGYPLHLLDPSYPPEPHSPAGLLIRRAAQFLRQQVQYSATERDKLSRRLQFVGSVSGSGVPTLAELPSQPTAAPLPPYYRPPVPVNYPEMERDTLHVEAGASDEELPVDRLAAPITISEEDIEPEPAVERLPPIRIRRDQISSAATPARVVTPQATPPPLSSFAKAVRQRFGRSREPFTTVKLRIQVQEYPDGPGYYGLQIRVSCQGVRSQVAGTTNHDGKLLCELPVRVHSGLTYDVDVTWPREMGGEVERKSITLNAERKEFTLPFYRRLSA